MTAWIIKAGAYAKGATRIGFVATNSTTQGEQVGQLWPILFGRCGLEIAFAHRTFAWGSDARGMAHVHVVILGLDRRGNARDEKRLFSYPDLGGDPEETRHKTLSPYLFDAGGLSDPGLVTVREEESGPINGFPRKLISRNAADLEDGNLTFLDADVNGPPLCPNANLSAAPYFLRPFPGCTRVYSWVSERWILHTADIPASKDLRGVAHDKGR